MVADSKESTHSPPDFIVKLFCKVSVERLCLIGLKNVRTNCFYASLLRTKLFLHSDTSNSLSNCCKNFKKSIAWKIFAWTGLPNNGIFTLKTHHMFSFHTTLEEFWICVWGRLWHKRNHMIIVTSSFSKSSVFKMFSSTRKRKPGVFKFLRFEELRFRDGLVWTEGLTVEIKLRFLNFSGVAWAAQFPL